MIFDILFYGAIVGGILFFILYFRKEITPVEYDNLKRWVNKYPEIIEGANVTRILRADYLLIKNSYNKLKYHKQEKIKEMNEKPELVNSRNEFLDSLNKD